MQALIRAVETGRLDARIAVVISNRPDAPGLEHARQAGIETLVVDHRQFKSRHDFDRRLATELKSRNVALVCLASFMRLVGAELLEAFPNAILNVHPSLLPAFPGVNAQQQALDQGVKVSGATVHLVTLSSMRDRSSSRPACRSALMTPSIPCQRGFWSRSTAFIPKPCGWCSRADGRWTAVDSPSSIRRYQLPGISRCGTRRA